MIFLVKFDIIIGWFEVIWDESTTNIWVGGGGEGVKFLTLDGWEVHSYTTILFLHKALAIASCPWGTSDLSVKSLKEQQNYGFDPSLR